MRTVLTRRQFAGLTAGLLSACGRPTPPSPVVELHIETEGDLLEFRPRALSCHTGDRVRLTFRHTGKYISSEHNWVLIKPGSFDAIIAAAAAAGEARGYLPVADPRMLAFTAPCGKGQEVATQFVAPPPGDYPFICTFPGHAQSMWGVLHVLPKATPLPNPQETP